MLTICAMNPLRTTSPGSASTPSENGGFSMQSTAQTSSSTSMPFCPRARFVPSRLLEKCSSVAQRLNRQSHLCARCALFGQRLVWARWGGWVRTDAVLHSLPKNTNRISVSRWFPERRRHAAEMSPALCLRHNDEEPLLPLGRQSPPMESRGVERAAHRGFQIQH